MAPAVAQSTRGRAPRFALYGMYLLVALATLAAATGGRSCRDIPLCLASGNGEVAKVHELLQAGAKADLRAKAGATALMTAAENGHTAVAEALLKPGPNQTCSARAAPMR